MSVSKIVLCDYIPLCRNFLSGRAFPVSLPCFGCTFLIAQLPNYAAFGVMPNRRINIEMR